MRADSIDWEKLLAYLDADEKTKIEELSDEEADMLLFAEKVRFKLRDKISEE